jgi:hypothetical protein
MIPVAAFKEVLPGGRHGQRADGGSRRDGFRLAAYALGGGMAIVLSLSSCAPEAATPITRPIEAMEAPWGPFARQCDSTRLSRDTVRWRVGETEIDQVYATCAGFSAMAAGPNAEAITASLGKINQSLPPVVLRIMRRTDGVARPAQPGDTGLLAQGSDAPDAAQVLARDIGLTARQMINPNETLALPLHLAVPFPLDVVMSCRPDGERRDRGRDTLLLSCTMDRKVYTDRIDAQLQLAGVEEIDVQTGVRLSSDLTGTLSGRKRRNADTGWHVADEQVEYRRETEFE